MAAFTTTALLAISAIAGAKKAHDAHAAGVSARKVMDANALLGTQQANDATNRGERDVSLYQQQADQIEGAQRAGFSSQGVKVDEGSAAQVQADAKTLAQQDIETIRLNAAREAWGYRTQAADTKKRGAIAEREGNNAALGSLIGTGSSLLAKRYGW